MQAAENNEEFRSKLQGQRENLVTSFGEIEIAKIIDLFYSESLLTCGEKDIVLAERYCEQRMRKFLDVLERAVLRYNKAKRVFLEFLKSNNQAYLLKVFEREIAETEQR